jgi:tripartite-type tricarboxylate transporter receptor subunit TctC
MKRRQCIIVTGFCGVLFLLSMIPQNGFAYPTRAVDVVIPYAAGGGTDIMIRVVTESLSKKWGQAINVINKPGGNSIIGTNSVMQSSPDGYTILGDGGGSSSMQSIMSGLPFKVEQRTFIASVAASPGVFVVPSSSPWNSLKDVADAAKKDLSKFSWASLGGASQSDLQLMQFFSAAGIDPSKTKMVVYPGAGPAVTAAAGGHVQFAVGSAGTALPLVSSKLLRVLALTSTERMKEFPKTPTAREEGFPSVDTVYWVGFSGPAGLPKDVAETWAAALKVILKDSDLISRLEKILSYPAFLGPDDFRKFVLEESQTVKKLLGTK